MNSKNEKDRQKQIQDRCQALLTQMLRDDDNKYCVDCDAKGPRWASWNLGVFLCIRCAGIHRNLGVHISKVKSVNLDSWTPEQVVSLQQMGNSRARAVYEANLPDSFRRPQTDSALESFIRAKYEHTKYIAREWRPPPLPKVNWDKEIEEEEKLKKKKSKAASAPISTAVVKKLENVIPAPLPKPASSPKSNRSSSGQTAVSNPTPQPPSADLLQLDSCNSKEKADDEIFGKFVDSTPAGTTSHRSEEEESFFSQTSTTGSIGQNKKMTKDSILALYSTSQPYNQVMGDYAKFGNFGGASAGTQFAQFPQNIGNNPPNNAFPQAMTQQSHVQNNNSAGNGGLQQAPNLSQGLFGTPLVGGMGTIPSSNPFYRMSAPNHLSSQPTMTHQMAGLSINAKESIFPPQQGSTVSNNIWQ